MAVLLSAEGLLLDAEFRPGDGGEGDSGFYSFAILPADSRETVEVWAFGDSAAAAELLRIHRASEAPASVKCWVGVRAKTQRTSGAPVLTVQLHKVVSAETGEVVRGRVDAASFADSQG